MQPVAIDVSTGSTAQGNTGAEFQRALNSKRREIPRGAKSQRARGRRGEAKGAQKRAARKVVAEANEAATLALDGGKRARQFEHARRVIDRDVRIALEATR